MSEIETPHLLEKTYQRYLERFGHIGAQSQWLQEKLQDPIFAGQLQLVWSCSDFVAEQCIAAPALFRELVDSGDLQRAYDSDHYLTLMATRTKLLADNPSEEHLHRQLRQFRLREMLRIIWRDFTRLASMRDTTKDVTLLAEACINGALEYLHPATAAELGTPIGRSGREQQLSVIAMGKMGAQELNLSSDIDLIFAYPESGETQGAKKTVSNQEFFLRLGQRLIAALDRQTADGFVFRVDMRLRPYGQSGSLVLNFAALEEYYLTQGRDWERYAMIKARVVAGASADAAYLHDMLQPFIYRRYLDYGSIESLRDLKRTINREVSRKGMQDNIKLGSGGIREVEFIAQTFQLIRGGRDSRLQTQSLHRVLSVLAEEKLLPEPEYQNLCAAYEFLRNTEHAIQGMADKQTQQLPQDELSQQRLATLMGYTGWISFYQQLQQWRQHVSDSFAAIISEPNTAPETVQLDLQTNWPTEPEPQEIAQYLEQLGYQQVQDTSDVLADMYHSRAVQKLEELPRIRLATLMPRLLEACAQRENNDQTLLRVLGLVQVILRRSAYLALLVENNQALHQLCILCERSGWIADELTAYPALLDELLDPRTLYSIPQKQHLRDQLRQQTMRIASEDLEQQMEVIRYYCRSYTLRAAACEVTNALPLMQVSDYLTWIAEVVVEHVVNVAWDQLLATYGNPVINESADAALSTSQTPGFIVVAYGKMGGIEMGYKSDLDLVFLHNGQASQMTDGPRSIDTGTFFMRLGQRIIHMLATSTPSGIAYEIDMRLRPSGNSGLLVSSLKGFEKYQQTDAWTWEHQALVRSRVVAGDEQLAAAYDLVRENTLKQKRAQQSVVREVQEMREKMRKHLGQGTKDGKFSLKQGSGGIVDIEFMVQFAVLAWSHEHPQLTRWSDTIRILESLAQSGLLSDHKSLQLIDAYKSYRSAGHRLQLQNQQAEVAISEFVAERKVVADLWQALFKS